MSIDPLLYNPQAEFQFDSLLGRIKRLLGDTKVVDMVDVAGRALLAQLPQGNALSVIVNATNAAADLAQLAFSVDGAVLKRSGTALVTGLIDAASLATGAVTFVKRVELSRRYTSTVGALATGAKIPLTAGTTKGTWAAVAADQQQVPEAGEYKAYFYCVGNASAVTNPMQVEVQLFVNGVSVGSWLGFRYTAISGVNNMKVDGPDIPFTITTPAGELVDWRVVIASGTFDPVDASVRLGLYKVSE